MTSLSKGYFCRFMHIRFRVKRLGLMAANAMPTVLGSFCQMLPFSSVANALLVAHAAKLGVLRRGLILACILETNSFCKLFRSCILSLKSNFQLYSIYIIYMLCSYRHFSWFSTKRQEERGFRGEEPVLFSGLPDERSSDGRQLLRNADQMQRHGRAIADVCPSGCHGCQCQRRDGIVVSSLRSA